MKYSARLVAMVFIVIAFVVATIVAAMVNTTTTAAKTVVSGVLTIGSSVTAGFVAQVGGVSFSYSSVSTLVVFLGIAAKRMTKATTRTMTATIHVSGAGREVKTTIPMHDMTQHRHLASEANTASADDTKNGFRRWLQWTIPFGGFHQVQRA